MLNLIGILSLATNPIGIRPIGLIRGVCKAGSLDPLGHVGHEQDALQSQVGTPPGQAWSKPKCKLVQALHAKKSA